MSVVRRSAAKRWGLVLGGALLASAIPPALAASPVPEPAPSVSAGALVEQVSRSDGVAHEGLVEVSGRLGLPTLPRLDEVSRLLDGTTRARVWWAGPQRWRVATLAASAERDIATTAVGLATWDYDTGTLVNRLGDDAVRLPRTDDLLPPQAARRLLATLGPRDRVERIAPRRVAGHSAAGVRILPGNPRSSIDKVDLWADPASGLPLAMEIFASGRRSAVLSTQYAAITFAVPAAADTAPPPRPRSGRSWTSSAPDLAARIDRNAPWTLPAELAGLPRVAAPGTLGGLATYGDGLTRFAVLPLPSDVTGDALRRAREIAQPLKVTGGEAVPLHRPLLSLVIARGADRKHAYLLAGTVRPDVLTDAVTELFANPPGPR